MWKYILKRLLMMIPVLLGVTFLVFFIMSMTPGDPAAIILGDQATPEAIAQLREELGLNDPLLIRYVQYIFDMLHGELSSDSSNMLKLLLKILSANKRNRSLKESSFMIPIPFIIDGEIKEVLLYISGSEEKRTNKQFTFIAYDDDKELCQISISKNNDNKYLICIQFFDEKLYNKCNNIRENIERDLTNFDNIKLEINYINNGGKNNG